MSKLERLQQDSIALKKFVEKLTKEGNDSLASKIIVKKKFLDSRINELYSTA